MLTVLDLFSGIGGFSLGLERTGGFRTVAFCEIDPYCRAVLRKHWPHVSCHDDIKTLDPPKADLICGGWPCQTHSTAARGRNVHEDMWPEFYRIIDSVRPSWVVAENVPRALDDWERIRSDLEASGYEATAEIFDTALPQRQRERIRALVVAHAHGDGKSWFALNEKAPCISEAPGRIREALPGIMGVADGIPSRVDRLRALGNAIVPQIAEMIGRAILASE